MDMALPPLRPSSSGFLSTGNLLQSLVHVSNEIIAMENLPFIQARNVSTMTRRIKLLHSLFEEIQESNTSRFHPSSILCLNELYSVIRRIKVLIQECKDGSSLWGLLQTKVVSNQFYALVKEMGKAIDILPLSLLDITTDVREQVELLQKQTKRADLFVDGRDVQRREDLLQVMAYTSDKKKSKNPMETAEKVAEMLSSIGLTSALDCEEEISKLEAEAQKQAGTGGLTVVSNINNLISILSHSKSMIFSSQENETSEEDIKHNRNHYDQSLIMQSGGLTSVPDEFRCPISLDLMKDPVIVASGHSYDRNSIARWINSGHHTCPKSGQRLIHMALIPNYALKSLIHQWCQEKNIPLTESSSLSRNNSKRIFSENVIDHISATKAAMDAVKMRAEFLVGKLAMGSTEIQRQAAYELRLLAKTSMDNRRIISEAGAIPFLMTLLTSHDPMIQENAVTALLNLSIFENNKILIMAAGATNNIIHVLESGKTMEARENAAATIFSLSIIDECKMTIGSHPRAIPALAKLLKDGATTGKRDAATALYNLAIFSANKARIARAGVVPLLIELLMDEKAGITDDVLGVLSIILSCNEGMEEIRKSKILVPLLIDLLRYGSAKGKENSITLLLGLCKNKDGGEEVARRLLINPRSIPSLQSLAAADASLKARRKAEALLRFLNRCCSHSHNRVG